MLTEDADITIELQNRISFYVLNVVRLILWHKQNVRLHRNSELILKINNTFYVLNVIPIFVIVIYSCEFLYATKEITKPE